MKATELMIGDYLRVNEDVCIKKDTIVEILNIDTDKNLPERGLFGCAYCRPLDGNQFNEWVWLDYLGPIPLTPEVLEKNSDGGFFYHDSPIIGYNGKRSTCHIGRASLYVEWERISMKPYIEIHGLGDTFYKNYVAGVHELQHALKICGIDKDIVL